jgi:hypothetical protein
MSANSQFEAELRASQCVERAFAEGKKALHVPINAAAAW